MSSFVDEVTLHARGGNGGAGVASFQKRKGKPRGRPNGGSGGKGGDVILCADPGVGTLLRYDRNPHSQADGGEHGEGELRHGRTGSDLTLPVPLGTLVRNDRGVMLGDLVDAGQCLVIARGGHGGRGNAAFVTPERRAPSFAEQGEYGEEQTLTLELQLLADVALVGYPNAGKSTLISRVSAATPAIADYPFTTLVPHLGVVTVEDREYVLADLPGLIEGAADGKGLGHEFLRHVERARALVVLLDPSDLQTDSPQRQYEVLLAELEAHSPDLVARPRLVVMSKGDLLDEVGFALDIDEKVFTISAVTGDGLPAFLHEVADLVELAEREAPLREGFTLHRPLDLPFSVSRVDGVWIIEGKGAERAANLNDLTVPEAADLVARRLRYLGVDNALRDAGAESGDDAAIGDLVFTYEEPEDERTSDE
jgi:GTP-binding protein